MKVTIRVPASTANLGPGFDSVGLALPLYLTIQATLSSDWKIINLSEHLPDLQNPSHHLIVETAIWAAAQSGKDMPACQLELSSEIPLARGLGSSASAIIGGLLLANEVAELNLSQQDILGLASQLEGHPDNVAASLFGGCVVAAQMPTHVEVIEFDTSDFQWVVAIPSFELKTEDARLVLPTHYARANAVQASANANMLIAALAKGNAQLVGYFMEQDHFHEPYRMELIARSLHYKQMAKEAGAYGTAISGAGPTLISLVSANFSLEIVEGQFPEFVFLQLTTCAEGAQIEKKHEKTHLFA